MSYFTRDIASKNFTRVDENAPIREVADIFAGNPGSGVIVMGGGSGKELLGVISLSDLLLPDSNLYIQTVLEILKNISVYGGDTEAFRARFAKSLSMRAKDVMNKTPVVLSTNDPLSEAARRFVENRRLNIVLVVNPIGEKLEGIIDRQAVLDFYYTYKHTPDAAPLSPGEAKGAMERGGEVKKTFEGLGKFSLVTKARARHWFGLSLIFVILGVILAFFWIVRIALRQ